MEPGAAFPLQPRAWFLGRPRLSLLGPATLGPQSCLGAATSAWAAQDWEAGATHKASPAQTACLKPNCTHQLGSRVPALSWGACKPQALPRVLVPQPLLRLVRETAPGPEPEDGFSLDHLVAALGKA